jgi:hypothetical protein
MKKSEKFEGYYTRLTIRTINYTDTTELSVNYIDVVSTGAVRV